MTDRNYVSLAGNPSGELFLTDYRNGAESAAPQLLRSAGDLKLLTLTLGDIKAGPGYADALKVSGAVNVHVVVGELHGGTEDCLDINHSSNVAVMVQRAAPKGRYVATIKGSQGITLAISEQVGHGAQADIDLGNWSDQSTKKTTGVSLFSKTTDGSAVQVRQLNASKPSLHAECRWKLSAWLSPFFLPVMRLLKSLKLA